MSAVMPSYNEVDGVPSHANRWLLEDVLRREWGFQGAVVSDYFGIQQLVSRQKVAVDLGRRRGQSLNAGVDIELPDGNAFLQLAGMIKDGRVTMARIDRAVSRILEMKMIAGLFEHPYVDVDEAERAVEHAGPSRPRARRRTAVDRPAREPQPRAAARSHEDQDDRRHRSECQGRAARRLFRRSWPRRGSALRHHERRPGRAWKIVYSEGVRITEADPNWDRTRS